MWEHVCKGFKTFLFSLFKVQLAFVCVCLCLCACVCVEPALTHSYNNDSGSRVDEQLILTVKREKGRRAELTAASPSHNSSVAHQALSHTYVERRQP